jgi:hypothetical protein
MQPILHHAKPILGMLIIIMILMNDKGKKTLVSALIASIAVGATILENYYQLTLLPTWLIYSMLFFAIWHNGNFVNFFRFLRSQLLTVKH